jgi:hypothetical protein
MVKEMDREYKHGLTVVTMMVKINKSIKIYSIIQNLKILGYFREDKCNGQGKFV